MSWKESLSVDVVSIDREHRQLAQDLDGLFAQLRQGMTSAEFLVGIDRLVEAVAAHFDHEERVMRNIGLEDYATHSQLHKALLEEMRLFRAELVAGADAKSIDAIEQFLRFWLYRHITAEDLKIFQHLNKQ